MIQEAEKPGGRSGPALSDLEILRRAQEGDDAAFEELVNRYGKELYGLALYLTGQDSDAEDVVQETFLGAYERLGAFEARSSVRTWLSRILMNQAARHHRSQRVRSSVQPLRLSEASQALLEGAATASPAAVSELRMDILEVLQALRPEHRAVVVLRELDGMSYRQIADVLDVPAGTVESRLFRARQELKEHLKDYLA
ncbi:MAG: sigma-70 family RNA polymerase sigma factor [Planctomycetota bacterium]|nr:sigma-70 family RNA polymerase sigma factor [Planctomycetota bacterium]